MFDVKEKISLLGELFGFKRRPALTSAPRQPGFSDDEIRRVLGRVPGPFPVSSVPPPTWRGGDVQKRLLDRAFDEMDRLQIPLQSQYDWVKKNCPQALPPRIGGNSERQYIVFNGAVPTTAAQVKMAVGTSVHTILQVLTPATTGITVLEWGISFDINATVGGVPVNCELFANDVAATAGTAVTPTVFGADATASLCVGGTGATMFSDGSVTEGTVANARMFDCQLVPPTASYFKQWPLGREPFMPPSKALRIRTTAPAAANAICYVVFSE